MTGLDLPLLALLVVTMPLSGGAVHRLAGTSLLSQYRLMLVVLVVMASAVVAAWVVPGRSIDGLGLAAPPTAAFAWTTALAAAVVVALGSYGWFIATPPRIERTRHHLAPVRGLLPTNGVELRWYVALGVTAGIAEEVTYRGYLLLGLQPGGALAALVLASVLFGAHHLYQGLAAAVRIAAFGAALGLLTLLAGSILAAITLHAAQNLATGLVAYRVLAR